MLYLNEFCKYSKKTPDELLKLKPTMIELISMMQKGVDVSTINPNEAEDLINDFLSTKKDTPSGAKGAKFAIITFFDFHNRALSKKNIGTWIEVITKPPRTPEAKDNWKDLRELEDAMVTERDKAILWFLQSCPVRKGTLKQLKWKDVVATNDPEAPYTIEVDRERLKGGYVGAWHIGFLHAYAAFRLKKYEDELKQLGIEKTPDSPLFMAYKNAYSKGENGQLIERQSKGAQLQRFNKIFDNASLKAWGNLTKRKYGDKRFSPHDMRDVLETVMSSPDVSLNENLIKPFLSHVVTDVSKHYAKHDKAEYLVAFKKALPFIVPKSMATLELEQKKNVQKIEDSNKTIAEQQEQINKQKEEHQKTVKQIEAQLEYSNKTIDEQKAQLDEQKKTILEANKRLEEQNQRITENEKAVAEVERLVRNENERKKRQNDYKRKEKEIVRLYKQPSYKKPKNIEDNPEACKRLLELLDEFPDQFRDKTLIILRESLLNPEKRDNETFQTWVRNLGYGRVSHSP